MSLLLDALKEAESRSADVSRTAPPTDRSSARRESPQPAQPLSLVEDIGTASPRPVAPPRGPSPPERETRSPPTAKAPRPAAPARAPWVRYATFAALPLLGALGWAMFRTTSEPPLALAPPVIDSASTAAALPPAVALAAGEAEIATPRAQITADTSVAAVATEVRATAPVAVPAESAQPAQDAIRPMRQAPEPSVGEAVTERPQVIVQRSSPLVAAHAALRAGDLPRAETLYRAALAGDSDQPDARLGMALIEHARGFAAAAMAHYRVVLEHRPNDPQAWAGIADLAGDGELEAVESRLRTLLASRPDPALHFALGNVLGRLARWPEAQESFFAAASGAPQNADYAFNLAVALDRLGKGRAAIPYYKQALTLAGGERAVQFDAAAVRARLELLESKAP